MICTEQQVHVLLEKAQHGDSDAAMTLCQCFLPEINRWVGHEGGHHDEIVQEACEALIFEIYRTDL